MWLSSRYRSTRPGLESYLWPSQSELSFSGLFPCIPGFFLLWPSELICLQMQHSRWDVWIHLFTNAFLFHSFSAVSFLFLVSSTQILILIEDSPLFSSWSPCFKLSTNLPHRSLERHSDNTNPYTPTQGIYFPGPQLCTTQGSLK